MPQHHKIVVHSEYRKQQSRVESLPFRHETLVCYILEMVSHARLLCVPALACFTLHFNVNQGYPLLCNLQAKQL